MLVFATSCSGPTPISAADAAAHYRAAGDSVADALSTDGLTFTHRDSRNPVQEDSGHCIYTAGFWDGSNSLASMRDESAWDSITRAAQGPATAAGFGAFSRPKRAGATTRITATDEHGARLVIGSQGRISILDARIDAPTCTADAVSGKS